MLATPRIDQLKQSDPGLYKEYLLLLWALQSLDGRS
jgi:hypothetical protein